MEQRPSDAEHDSHQPPTAAPPPNPSPPPGPPTSETAPHPAVESVLRDLGGNVEALVAVSASTGSTSPRAALVDVHHRLRRLAWLVNAALATTFGDQR
ncbi:hypothetical protein [Micromonospora sp. DT227]|uniref:hypothetical protein n=1 Tax=Micromonospora sp. DT227 TaxID=3393433 RepID=UPI003CF61D53